MAPPLAPRCLGLFLFIQLLIESAAMTTVQVQCGNLYGGYVVGTTCANASVDPSTCEFGHWAYVNPRGQGALRLGDTWGKPPATFKSFLTCAFPPFFGAPITSATLVLNVASIYNQNPLNSSWLDTGASQAVLEMSYGFGSTLNITAEDFQAPASVTNAAVCTYNDAPANAPTLSCVLSAVAVAALQADTYLQFRLSLLNATNGDNIPDQVRFWGGDSAFPPVLSVVSGTAGDAFNALPYSLVPNAPNDVPSANSLSSVVTVVQSSSQWNSKTIAAVAVGSIGCTVLAVWAVVRTKRVVAGMSKKRSSKVYAEDEGKYVPPKVQATTRLLAHADSQSADGEGEEENTGSPITSARGPKKSPRAELKAALSKKPHSPPPVPISASVSQASAASSATGQDKPAANPVFQLESVNDPSDSDGKDSDNESDKQAEKAPLNPNFGISKVIAAADSSSGPTGRRASNLPGISTTVGESKTVQVDSGSISDEPMSDADDVDVPVAAQPSPPRSPVPMDSDSDTGGRTMSGGLPEPEPAPRKSATSKPKASSKRNSTGKPRRSTSGRE